MRIAALVMILLLVLIPPVAKGQSKTGTAVGQFLLIEPSARIAAMGNVGVALSDGIQSIYYNPAAIGRLETFAVQFTHSEWFAGIAYEYAAGAMPVKDWGNLFASVTALNSGDIDVRTVEQPLGTGERYTVEDLAVGVGFGREFSGRFAAGIQVNYVTETIWHSSLKTMTLNVGATYRLSSRGLQIGSSISNYGATARYRGRDLAFQYDNDPDRYGDNSALPGERLTGRFPVPVLFRVGVSMPRQVSESSEVLLAVDAYHPSDNTESLGTGVEWTWKETLSLRGGYQNLFLKESEVGLTLGAGLKGRIGDQTFGFDYAWADHGRLSETHRMTFVLEL